MEGPALPNNVDAVLDQIEAQQAVELKSKSTPLEFLQAVYSNEGLPLQARLKAAIEASVRSSKTRRHCDSQCRRFCRSIGKGRGAKSNDRSQANGQRFKQQPFKQRH